MWCNRIALGVLAVSIAAVIGPVPPAEGAGTSASSPAQPAPSDGLRADFDGDGFEDLAIGAPDESSAYGQRHGAVSVVYGSAAKLAPARSATFSPADLGQPNAQFEHKFFGLGIATGDFDGDGFDDLAVGAPGQWVGPAQSAGAVDVLFGSPAGLTTSGAQLLTQDAPGVGDSSDGSDFWGLALTGGDFDGDGVDDLAVGAPNEVVGGVDLAGAVTVLRGSPGGLTGTGGTLLTQAGLGVGRPDEEAAAFGSALAAGDFDGSGVDDLAIGTPTTPTRSGGGPGSVSVAYAAPGGLGTGTNQIFHQDSPGIGDVAEELDAFGSALAAGDLNGSGADDLAIGVRGEDVGAVLEAGAVHVLYGRAGGITAASSVVLTQDTAGVGSAVEIGDRLGSSVAIGDLNGSGRDDLAIGAPGETVGSVAEAGAVNVLYGRAGPITGLSSQLFTQDTAGIGSTAEPSDRFGWSSAIGDFDGTGAADLAVGSFGESVGTTPDAGAVHAIYRRTSRLDATTSQLFTEDVVAGQPGAARANEHFGDALAPAG